MQRKTWYYEKWVGRQAAFSPTSSVKFNGVLNIIFTCVQVLDHGLQGLGGGINGFSQEFTSGSLGGKQPEIIFILAKVQTKKLLYADNQRSTYFPNHL